MKWVVHVASMGEMRNAYNVLVGTPKGKSYWEDLCVDGRIILELILRKYSGKAWTGFNWLRI
jgi:hypothetical protein